MLKNLGSYDASARHNSWVLCVRFSPDGKIIATAGADCSVRLWSVETARLIVKLEGFRGWVRALAWTNDGSRLAAACNDCDVYAITLSRAAFV
jgi:WD40 repeat protein